MPSITRRWIEQLLAFEKDKCVQSSLNSYNGSWGRLRPSPLSGQASIRSRIPQGQSSPCHSSDRGGGGSARKRSRTQGFESSHSLKLIVRSKDVLSLTHDRVPSMSKLVADCRCVASSSCSILHTR